ncbi:MAG: ATPase, T2SS/T4P/T4SS family, partial [Pseudonocardiaceae bacterium]
IVVGEVRGPEALDMLQAMNTGHEGSLSTCHANGPDDALRRLETMVLMDEVRLPLAAVRAQLESALDLIIQVGRHQARRRILAISEVRVSHDDVALNDVALNDVAGNGILRPGTEARTRLLVDSDGVVALPRRPGRATGATPPDARWITG